MFKIITSGTDFIKPEVALIATSYYFITQRGFQDRIRICLQHIQGWKLLANIHHKHFKIH